MIGSHTARKTAASYVSSVSSVHSESAFCLRMGWKLAGAKGRYIQLRADSHGDSVIGRILARLPVQSADFATLPPHFAVDDDRTRRAIKTCFPNAPTNLNGILELCLASLVFHKEFLKKKLAPRHPLFSSPLFADSSLDFLAGIVQCGLPNATSRLQSSGIPTLTTVLIQLREQNNQVAAILPRLRELPEEIVGQLDKKLEEKAVGYGQVTVNGLEDHLKRVLEPMLRHLQPEKPQLDEREQVREPHRTQLHQWGGGFHLVPESFALPKVGLRLAWQSYMCPNAELQVPPLRSVSSRDMSTAAKKKRLSEFQVAMREIQQKVEEVPGRWIPYPSFQEADAMFHAVEAELGVGNKTQKGRQRRISELNWRTAARDIRAHAKRRREAESDEDEPGSSE